MTMILDEKSLILLEEGARAAKYREQKRAFLFHVEQQDERRREEVRAARIEVEALTKSVAAQITATQQALARAMAENEVRIRDATQAIERIRAGATRMEDGHLAYLTRDGRRAFRDDGVELSQEEINRTHWRPGGSTWEDRKKAGEELAEALREQERLKTFKERADYYHDRSRNGDLSPEEMHDINRDLDGMADSLRDQMKRHDEARHEAPAYPSDRMKAPDLAGEFGLAASELEAIRAATAPKPKGPPAGAPAP